MLRKLSRHLTLVLLALAVATSCATAPVDPPDFPRRVLLTNDNGIDDTGLIELARACARVPGIDVIVVAAAGDRSGTSNYLGATRTGQFRVERRDLGPHIEAWALDGYPADCVIFALTGPLRERLPDVVVSGINGGQNMADDWFGSGTIGAARTAAYFGIPAVAVSGLEDDHAGAVEAATSWVVRFVQSSIVAALAAPQYLTVSLPDGTPPDISGARIVERARGLMTGSARRVGGGTDADSAQVWLLDIATHPERAAAGTDVPTVAAGYIAIVPMRVDEYDAALAARLRDERSRIPEWIAPEAGGSAELFACGARPGITFGDAE
ncbi:MAG TPA: 5'/3'-nucleotidase SurE, partial [Thermoanaerobaculia bacterium]|nr:5'/3'-nucleotidase SurE [Thermoanaerobaculia bacterium]